jgi:hypothetical protein
MLTSVKGPSLIRRVRSLLGLAGLHLIQEAVASEGHGLSVTPGILVAAPDALQACC